MNNEKTIYKKLLAVQKEVGGIKKAETNPFFKSAYFDINGLLEVLKPVLTKNNLVVMQPLQVRVDSNVLSTVLIDVESGEKIESNIIIPVNPDPQKMGAIITYFRRYSLQSLLALQAVDNDANDTYTHSDTKSPANAQISPNNGTVKLGICETCQKTAMISTKPGHRQYCPDWKLHKSKGEASNIIFPPAPMTKKEEEFVKELTEEEEIQGLNIK